MKNQNLVFKEKIDSLVIGKSNWKEKALKRRNDRLWLKKSKAIAFLVLDALKAKQMKQVHLAEMLGVTPQQVNKIVKGQENLTLETISNLEEALGIHLFVAHDNITYDLETSKSSIGKVNIVTHFDFNDVTEQLNSDFKESEVENVEIKQLYAA